MKKSKKGKFEFSEEEKKWREEREEEARKAHEEAVKRAKEHKELLKKAKIGAEAVKNYEKQHLDVLLLGLQEAFKRAADKLEEDWMDNYYLGIQMLLREHKPTEKQKKLVDLERIKNTRRKIFRALIPAKIKEAFSDFDRHYNDWINLDSVVKFGGIDQLKEKAEKLGVKLNSEQKKQLQELKRKVVKRANELKLQYQELERIREKQKKKEVDEYNKKMLGLDDEQYNRWEELMYQINMNEWPKSLMDYVNQVGAKIGLCGEVIVESVAEWIKKEDKNKKK